MCHTATCLPSASNYHLPHRTSSKTSLSKIDQPTTPHQFVGVLDTEYNTGNIAKGTTDPRVEFILPKKLFEVTSQDQTQIMITFHLQNLD